MDINELKSNTKLLISKSNRDDVISKFPPNWMKIADSEVIRKVSLVYDSMGWDLSEISMLGIQTKLDEW